MTKGSIFNLLKLENGLVISLFKIFKIGFLMGEEDYRNYLSMQIGISKLEFTLSIALKSKESLSISDIEGYS